MAKRILFLLMVITLSVDVSAQSRGNETVVPVGVGEPDSLRVGSRDSTWYSDVESAPLTYDEQIRVLNAKYKATQLDGGGMMAVPEFSLAMPVPGLIASWGSGGVFGATSMASLPGLMGVESGRIGLYQNIGRFSFTAYGAAEKYGYLNGLDRVVGFGGTLTYRASDRISFTVFGSYYSPLRSPRGAQAGYIAIPSFGGYMDYGFNEHWGVEVGAQGYRSSATGDWRAQPIVKPYYRINRDVKIGVDVGGILYNLLYMNQNRSSKRMLNPTVPIPKMGALPVGPRD